MSKLRGMALGSTALVAVAFCATVADAQYVVTNQQSFESAVAATNANPGSTMALQANVTVASPSTPATTPLTIALNSGGQAFGLGLSGLGGAGSVNVTGIGAGSVLTLTGANGFNGLTGSSSVIAFDSDAALGIGTIRLNSQTFRTLADVNVTKAIVLGNQGATIDTNGHTMAISGVVSGGSPLYAYGPGTLVLSGANTYSAATNLLNGVTVRAGAANVISTASAVTQAANTTFDLAGYNQSIGSLSSTEASSRVLLGSATLTTGSDNSTTSYQGVISGAGSLVKTGSGRFDLLAANTFTGTTTVVNGTLRIGAVNGSSITSTQAFIAGGVLDLESASAISSGASVTQTGGTLLVGTSLQLGSLSGSGGGVQFASGSTLTIGGNGSNDIYGGNVGLAGGASGNLTKVGGGTLTLTDSNGLTGITTISSGTLQLGNGGTTGELTATSNVVDNGTLVINRANTTTFDRAVSGSGLIINRGAGMATLAGALTNGGVETEVGSGGVTLTGSLTTAGTSYAGSNPAALVDQGGTQVTLAGGTVTATSASGAEDGMQLNGGTFTVASGSLTAMTSGVWARAGGGIQNSGTITGGDSSVYFSGSGSQSLTVSGGGTYIGNGYRGIYAHADAGNVVLGTATSSLGMVSGALGGIDAATTSGTLDIVAGGAVSAVSGNAILATSTSGRISINASGTLTAGGAGNAAIYLSGNNAGNAITIGSDGGTPTVAQGWIGLRLAGTGTTTLTNYGTISAIGGGANAVEIDAGTLVVGEQAGTIMGNIAVTAADTALTVNRATNLVLSNTITGAGTLNKSGAGLLTLTGVNSDANGQFSGVANVNAGILSINGTFGNTTFNNAYINVGSGGILHGSGTIAGSVGVLNGGTVSAGNSPGTLTVNGNYMLASGATSLFELGTPNIAGGAGNDLINVAGNLTLGGTLSLVSAADAAASPVTGAYRLYNYRGALSGSFDGITTPTAQSATVYTSIPGQVNVLVTNVGQYVQYWDGTDSTGAVPGPQGGAGVWSETGTNWTGSPTATVNAPWAGGVGIFTGPADTVTITGAQDVQGLQFTADGYNLTGAGSLNLTGDPFSTPDQSFINVDDGVGATISTALTSTSGAIGLNKIGAGTLTLSGANSYTGKTSVTAGTLVLAQTGSLASDVTVGVDGTFENAGTVAGAVTSSGITTNSGTIGGTVNNSGTLVSTGLLANGLVNSGTASISGQIEGAVTNSGMLTIAVPTSTPTVFTNNGVTDLGGTALTVGSLAGTVTAAVLQNGQLTTGGDNNSTTYAGAIADGTTATSLTKVGTGTLTLSGASIYTGETTVSSGTLNLIGSLVSKVIVGQGAVFTGAGTTGGLAIAGGGVVSPGEAGAISPLSVAGTVSFAAGSLYQVNASADGNADRINASGQAILKGGTVQVTAGNGQYAARTRYTILSAQGGVTGTFTDTTSNFAFLTPLLSYDANDVYLTLARNDLDFGAVATTPNQLSVANAVQVGSAGSQLYDAVAVLSAAQARQAFDALSGEIHSSAVTAQFRTASTVRNAVLDRLHAAASPNEQSAGTSLWGQVFGTFGSIGSNGNTGRLVQQDSGFTLGLDTQVSPAWRLGIAGGYSDASLHVSARASTGSIESGYGALYAGGTYGALRLHFGGSYAWSVVDTHRSVGFAGVDAVQQSAHYGATVGQAFGQIGYRLGSADISIEPFVSGGTVHVERNRFAEAGGASALAANGKNYNLQTSVVGAQGEGRLDTILGLHSPLSLLAMAGYQRTYGDRMPATLLTLRDTGQSFGTTGAPIARNALVTQAGLGWRIAPGMSLSVDYTGQVGSDRTRDNGVKGSFSYRW